MIKDIKLSANILNSLNRTPVDAKPVVQVPQMDYAEAIAASPPISTQFVRLYCVAY